MNPQSRPGEDHHHAVGRQGSLLYRHGAVVRIQAQHTGRRPAAGGRRRTCRTSSKRWGVATAFVFRSRISHGKPDCPDRRSSRPNGGFTGLAYFSGSAGERTTKVQGPITSFQIGTFASSLPQHPRGVVTSSLTRGPGVKKWVEGGQILGNTGVKNWASTGVKSGQGGVKYWATLLSLMFILMEAISLKADHQQLRRRAATAVGCFFSLSKDKPESKPKTMTTPVKPIHETFTLDASGGSRTTCRRSSGSAGCSRAYSGPTASGVSTCGRQRPAGPSPATVAGNDAEAAESQGRALDTVSGAP